MSPAVGEAAIIGAALGAPRRTAVLLDYDGTLAPIVADPAGARPLPGVAEVLTSLGEDYGEVAVVSGRPVAFLADHLGPPPGVDLVGLYGMEHMAGDGTVRVAAEAERWRPVVAAVTEAALREVPAGVEVEPKGLSVTLHWRAAPAGAPWVEEFARTTRARAGLVAQPGRMALELRPPIETDKGTVVTERAGEAAVVLYFGDDLGDLPAFDALDLLARRGRTVARVAVVDADSPPAVARKADVVVDGPAGALDLLRRLAGAPVGPAGRPSVAGSDFGGRNS